MKLLTAAVAALGLLGFAGAAAAGCVGHEAKAPVDQTAQTPVVLPPAPAADS